MKILFAVILATLSGLTACSFDELIPEEKSSENAQEKPFVPPTGACEEGETREAADGCNRCSCNDGIWGCTEMGCQVQGECQDELPEELATLIDEAYQKNQAERNSAIEAERLRLSVSPLKPSTIMGTTSSYTVRFKPDTDPFPDSLVAVGESYDIRTEGYEVNHGKMDMTLVYETAPGSKEYFIVDRIGGDGIGSNLESVVAESVEYGLLNLVEDLQGNSWHSWHSTEENFIMRAYQSPKDQLKDEVRICGCGPMGYEVDSPESSVAAGDAAPPVYQIAVFMLPGDDLPVLGEEKEMNAEFPRDYFKKIYVPAEGKKCVEHAVAC